MKITNEIQRQNDTSSKRQALNETPTFNKMLQSQSTFYKQQEIDNLMKHITLQGNILAKSRTFRDLAKFKRLVKALLNETVSNGYSLEKKHSFGMNGNQSLTIIKEIDNKLIEITKQIMGQEEKTVNILGLIGEIKGLLMDLYT